MLTWSDVGTLGGGRCKFEMTDQEWVDSKRWFHAIDFGDGLASPGRFGPNVPPNYTLYGTFEFLRQMDLSRARCLDVGAMDGLASFVMKGLGAREVTACDMAPRETFLFGRKALGLDVDYKTPVTATALPEFFAENPADLLVLAGVLYHVFDPLTVLVACRECVRPGGYLIVETTHDFHAGGPTMSFNPVDESPLGIDMPHVYWRPSKRTLVGMLQLAGFSVMATTAVNARLTVLAKAVRPDEIDDRPARIAKAQDRHRHKHYKECADFDSLAAKNAEPAAITYSGPTGDRFLYRARFYAAIPYQPRWEPDSPSARAVDTGLSLAVHTARQFGEMRARVVERLTHASTQLLPEKVRESLVAAQVGGANLRDRQK